MFSLCRLTRWLTANRARARRSLTVVCFLLPGKAVVAQSVTGHAYVTLASGEGQLVRGTEVILTCSTPEIDAHMNSLRAVMEQAKLSLYSSIQAVKPTGNPVVMLAQHAGIVHHARGYLPRLVTAYRAQWEGLSIIRTRTDFEGEYLFDSVPPGSYRLVAHYATVHNKTDWEEPVEVVEGRQAKADLSNFNMIDLDELVGMDVVKSQLEAIDRMVSRMGLNERLAFVQGALVAFENGMKQSLPSAMTTTVECR